MKTVIRVYEQNNINNHLAKTQSPYQFSLRSYVNFKVFKFKNSKWPPFLHFWSYVKTVITLNEQTQIRNNLVKTKYQNLFSLRRYVNFYVFKFKNSKWPPFLHFWSYVKTVDTLQERNLIRNHLVFWYLYSLMGPN